MDELFRFTVTRPPDRTSAGTIPLERSSSFQETLLGIMLNDNPRKWPLLVGAALDFLDKNSGWLASLADPTVETGDPALLRALEEFQRGLNKALNASPSPKWPDAARKLAEPFTPQASELDKLNVSLADLFLALFIFRSGGAKRINTLIPQKAALAELLRLDRPSLNELAAYLRALDLLLRLRTDPQAFARESLIRAALRNTLMLPPPIFARLQKPVHAVGVTDLLVVKQHIHHYELGEIARIENILEGESRSHSQKHTLSNERETVFETEATTETEEELTATDHVSIRNEVENILKEDVKVEGGVHAQYDGGSYKIQADLTAAYDRSSTNSKKFASEVAKDITQKAAKRVTQRVLQRTRTKVVETFEDAESQTFDNKKGSNISGVYQWLEKVYLAQVFNYGRHLLFDVMVPEPAASLLAAVKSPTLRQRRPVPPEPLGTIKVDGANQPILDADGNLQLDKALLPSQLSPGPTTNPALSYYGDWVAKFQVTGVEPPAPETITAAQTFSEDARESGNVHLQGVMKIEDGYAASTFSVLIVWRTKGGNENDSQMDVLIGEKALFFKGGVTPDIGTLAPAKDSQNYGASAINVPLRLVGGVPQLVEQRAIGIALESTFSEEAAINIELRCERTPELLAKWQLQTYDKIATQWKALWDQYQSKLASLQVRESQEGILSSVPPEINRQTERRELKRSAIAILADDTSLVDGKQAVLPWQPVPKPSPDPELLDPDLATSQDIGSDVRFFEQAFEWDRISYVFYPYFWGRATMWLDRLQITHDDPLFENFLKAGYARVVIPVRNGFEDAVNFFLLTGQPWMGGGLPSVGDKTYLPITEEIKEQTGAPGDEVPVDQPWFIRLPTRLMKLRTGNEDTEVPRWKRSPTDTLPPVDPWTWEVDDS